MAEAAEAAAAYDYDIVIIGGGSGGLACSKECAKFGARVAVLDYVKPSPQGTTWGLGGTCVNVGCIPKKLFHTAGILGESLHDAESYGWSVPTKGPHDWAKLVDAVQDYISSLNFGYRTELREKSVTYLNVLGSFVDPHTLECVDKRSKRTRITAKYIVIAVGGRPRQLDIPGREHVISSDDIFSLATPPGKTLCVGASYVSLECAGFLNALGYDTTVMVRSIILRGFDKMSAEMIDEHMVRKGVKFIREALPTSIVKQEDGRLLVTYTGAGGVVGTEVFDTVLSAIGRYADVEGLNLPAAGVVVGKDGKLTCVNEQTNVPNIFAIGDVISKAPELTPVAIKAGRLLAARLFAGSTALMDYKMVPTTVFTPLEYGCVGLSEEEAIEKYGEDRVESFLSGFMPLEWKLTDHRASDTAYAKLVCDKEDNLRVLGFHVLGPNAGEITQGFAVAVKLGATYHTFCDTVGIQPTTAEEFTTLTVTRSSGLSAAKGGC